MKEVNPYRRIAKLEREVAELKRIIAELAKQWEKKTIGPGI